MGNKIKRADKKAKRADKKAKRETDIKEYNDRISKTFAKERPWPLFQPRDQSF